ncbi:MAG: family 16 glycosylhydrolase [Cyclobacteriaceae bacterium]|nr:family 16 glycosylhydrolase [Cyclobacteriaceae bacterium]
MASLLHMRIYTVLILVFCISAVIKSHAQCEVLVWSDEFNGSGSPDSQFWGYDLGGGGWGNQESQIYTNNTTNVRQEDGRLIIDVIKSGNTWTSARIKTQNKLSFKYGKIVFRAKLPTGVGTWPALWMLGDNFPSVGWPACGEIDIMEHVGRNPNVVMCALHNPSSYGDTQNKSSINIPSATTEFNEYAISWNEDRIIFYVNDVPYYTYSPTTKTPANWPYDAGHFMIINLAIGGTLGGTIDANLTSARLEVDWVRVYEQRSEPLIQGTPFLFENQQGAIFSAPDYGTEVTYTWSVPNGASIVSGQGTKEVTINWGPSDGTINLLLTGETGCSVNTTSLNVTTIVDPTGLKHIVNDFSSEQLTGWTKNDNGITMQIADNQLSVNFNTSTLRYIQYEMPRAVRLSDYSILKVPIKLPSASTKPRLLLTFIDGDGKETIATNYDIPLVATDGKYYMYAYNFNGLWNVNTPPVNDNYIKSMRIYMFAGQGQFQLGTIAMYNSRTIPQPPTNLSASITETGEIALQWTDNTNATNFNIYRSSSPAENFIRILTGSNTFQNPLIISPTEQLNYYKVSGVNSIGESALSEAIEIVANITGVEINPTAQLNVYPNPCNGRFFIQTNGVPVDDLKIFNAVGVEQPYKLHIDQSLLVIDLKTPVSGIYFLILSQANKTTITKVSIQ